MKPSTARSSEPAAAQRKQTQATERGEGDASALATPPHAVPGNQTLLKLLAHKGQAKAAGTPLPMNLRQRAESVLGQPLGAVRVHRDAQAVARTQTLGARAFTHGADIYLGAGAGHPGTALGNAVLAHEIAHTVQQGGQHDSSALEAAPIVRLQSLETEAHHAAGAIVGLHAMRPKLSPGARGIQLLGDELEPMTELTEAYENTPNAGKAPQGRFSSEGFTFDLDGDGDQVPELRVRIKDLKAIKAPAGGKAGQRIRIEIEQLKPGTNATAKAPGARDSWEFEVPPDATRMRTFPSEMKVTDGFAPTEFSLSEQPDGARFQLKPPLPRSTETVYPASIAFGGLSGKVVATIAHDFKFAAAWAPAHNVFAAGNAVRLGPNAYNIDMNIGAYGDNIKITVFKPNAASDEVELIATAVHGGRQQTQRLGTVSVKNPLNVQVVGAAGGKLELDLDGDGTADIQLYDRLTEKSNSTSAIQTPDVTRFREHRLSLVSGGKEAGWALFDVEGGVLKGSYAPGSGQFFAGADAAVLPDLTQLAAAGGFAQQQQAVEQARMTLRRKARDDGLIGATTADRWDSLGRFIVDQMVKVGTDPKANTDSLARAVSNKATQLLESLRTEGGSGRASLDQQDVLDPPPLVSLGPPAGVTGSNPFTGEHYYYGAFGRQRVLPATLAQLAKASDAGDWARVRSLYNTVCDQIDRWIIKQLAPPEPTPNQQAGTAARSGVAQMFRSAAGDPALQDQRLANLVRTATSLRTLEGKTGVEPAFAMFTPADEFRTKPDERYELRLFYYREGDQWKLTDLTRQDDPFTNTFEAKPGELLPPHELFMEMNTSEHFPKGVVHYLLPDRVDASGARTEGRIGRVECTEPMSIATFLGYAAAGIAAAGFIAMTAGVGSIAVTGLFVAAGVVGAASSVADMIEQARQGHLTPERAALDVVQIIGSLAGAGAGIAAEVRGAQALVQAGRASKLVEAFARLERVKGLLVPLTAATAGADVIQFVHMAHTDLEQLQAIDKSGATESDRLRAKVLLLTQLAVTGGMTILSVRGAVHELGAKPPRVVVDIIDNVPYARIHHANVGKADYEKALASALSSSTASKLEGKLSLEVLDATQMAAKSGSPTARAVVRIEGGMPKVYVLEGSHPSAVLEEALHVEQFADPKLGKLMSKLDESKLANWAKLGAKERLELTRAKMTLEIDAQERVIAKLQAQIDAAGGTGTLKPGSVEANDLFAQLDDAWQNLEHLRGKSDDLVGVERLIGAGKTPTDTSLIDDVPRLMAKKTKPGFDLDTKWQTMTDEEFLAAYNKRYPNTRLSDAELLARFRQGKRLKPSSWRLADPAARNAPEVPAANRAKLSDEARVKLGGKEIPLKPPEQQKLDALIARRDKWRAQKRKLEKTGPSDSDALRTARYELNDASREIGEFAAASYVKGKYKDLVEPIPLYGGGPGSSRAGDFDMVFKRFDKAKNRFEYIVVEAKGGSSDLGARKVGNEYFQQGHKKYFKSIVDNMMNSGLGTQAKNVAKELAAAKADQISYILVKAPMEAGEKTVLSELRVADFL